VAIFSAKTTGDAADHAGHDLAGDVAAAVVAEGVQAAVGIGEEDNVNNLPPKSTLSLFLSLQRNLVDGREAARSTAPSGIG
jgi:hypothetical protein